jgi:hypothetical protein
MGIMKKKLKLWLQGLKMGKLQTISWSIIKDSRTLGGQGNSTHSTMLLNLLRIVAAWQVTTMTKLALVAKIWVGGRGTFHGCVTNLRLMMIPKGIYFGLWRDLWELMIPKRIYFGLLGHLWELMFPKRIYFGSLRNPWELIICKKICFGLWRNHEFLSNDDPKKICFVLWGDSWEIMIPNKIGCRLWGN